MKAKPATFSESQTVFEIDLYVISIIIWLHKISSHVSFGQKANTVFYKAQAAYNLDHSTNEFALFSYLLNRICIDYIINPSSRKNKEMH